MALRDDHYAIVLTINRYPGLSDLDGPENDGLDFKDWLLDERYGALRPDNVRHICSSDFGAMADVYEGNPTERELIRALDRWLRVPPEVSASGWRDRHGERLYLYFAGHGFTAGSSLTDPALFSAVAQSGDAAHIAAYRYASRIANAGFFDEIVLAMDCCQDVLKASTVIDPTWSPPDRQRSGAVKLLQAYGAPRGRRSFEREIGAQGQSRGLFSSVLMEALRNAAADEDGWVTGATVKALFLKLWNQRYKGETGYDPPLRLPDGDDIRLYRRTTPEPVATAVAPVPIDLSEVIKRAAQIEDAAGADGDAATAPLPGAFKSLRSADLRRLHSPVIELEPGLHVLRTAGREPDLAFEVPFPGADAAIETAAAAPVTVDALGDHRAEQSATVSAPPAGVQIAVLDADYAVVGSGIDRVSLLLAPGLYKAQATIGTAVESQLFTVADAEVSVPLPLPAFAAAAPVQGTSTTHEYQSHPARVAAETPVDAGPALGEVFVFLRDSAHRPDDGSAPASFDGQMLTLRSLDAHDDATLVRHGDDPSCGYAWFKLIAAPGSHALLLLRHLDAPALERGLTVPVVAGWRTEVYVDCAHSGDRDDRARRLDPGSASIHLVRRGAPSQLFDPPGVGTEAARAQSAAGRTVAALPPGAAAIAPMWALLAAFSAWDEGRRNDIAAALAEVPAEVRTTVCDFVLLDRWLADSAQALAPLSRVPVLAAAWRLAVKLGAAGLAPEAAEAFGQWREAGSLWTAWNQQPGFAFAGREHMLLGPLRHSGWDDDPYSAFHESGRSESDLEPPWALQNWRQVAIGLRRPDPSHSPFQQALRRLLLDALEVEVLPEKNVFDLADEFAISHRYAADAYRQLYADARRAQRSDAQAAPSNPPHA